MTTLREAAQRALEALEEYQANGAPFWACDGAVAALRAALAEPVQEPDAYCVTTPDGGCVSTDPRCMHNTPFRAAQQALEALEQIAVLVEYGTTGPGKCDSRPLSEKQATALRLAVSDISRAQITSLRDALQQAHG